MLSRALIVLLLVLNLGVASWWALWAAPAPATALRSARRASPAREGRSPCRIGRACCDRPRRCALLCVRSVRRRRRARRGARAPAAAGAAPARAPGAGGDPRLAR